MKGAATARDYHCRSDLSTVFSSLSPSSSHHRLQSSLTGIAIADGGLLVQGVQLQEVLVAGRGLQVLGILGRGIELLKGEYRSVIVGEFEQLAAAETHLLQGHVD